MLDTPKSACWLDNNEEVSISNFSATAHVIAALLYSSVSVLFIAREMSYSKRAFLRTFVLLDKRIQAVPSKPYWERLANGGRVKEIVFTKNTTAAQIGDKIKDAFPSLAGSDLSR